jgi:hypothetical protein
MKQGQVMPPGLRLQHRNILQYYYHHKKKYAHTPCFVPKSTVQHLCVYLRALEKLEELKLISIVRNGDNYQGWIIKDPK